MNKKIILLPALMLLLASCNPGPGPTSEGPTPEPHTNEIAPLYDKAAGDAVEFRGKYVAAYSGVEDEAKHVTSLRQGVFVADGDHAVLVYGATDEIMTGISVGDMVRVTGAWKIYSGLGEVDKPAEGTITVTKVTDWTAEEPTTLAITAIADLKGKMASRKVTATGTVGPHVVNTYGNVIFDLTISAGNVINVRGDSRYVSAAALARLEAATEGSTVTITGYLGVYSSGATTIVDTGFQIVNPDVAA